MWHPQLFYKTIFICEKKKKQLKKILKHLPVYEKQLLTMLELG